MRDHLVLLPGWGLGCAPLQPLVEALGDRDADLQVAIQPLPALTSSDPEDWLDALDALISPGAWLGGWSLGGMLAAGLAARRAARCPGLVTLASNARFVACQSWPAAMAEDTFRAFRDGCAGDPVLTLKRFCLLCSQGAADPRGLARQLSIQAPGSAAETLLAGLDVLAESDTRAALQAYGGMQLHLFAGDDALVPRVAAQALQETLPHVQVEMLEPASHAFAFEQPQALAARIAAFLREVRHD